MPKMCKKHSVHVGEDLLDNGHQHRPVSKDLVVAPRLPFLGWSSGLGNLC